MRLNQTGTAVLNTVQIVGKIALYFMRIGATRTAINTLMEYERQEVKSISGQMQRGYEERIQPQVRNQIKKFNVIKGGKA